MSKRRKKPKSTAGRRFRLGDRVRVKRGVVDVDYPDIPLGGWAGTIAELHRGGVYTVRWSRETLENIHPVYRKRCESDESVLEEYWLADEDLLSDPGGPLASEQPKEIKPRRLAAQNQGDRVRKVFALTGDDFLPCPDDETLATYYDYLVKELSFPFEARYYGEWAPFDRSRPRVVRAVGLARDFDVDDQGIMCEVHTSTGKDLVPLVELEVRRSDPNHQHVDDYTAWFAGDLAHEFDAEGDDEVFGDDDELEPESRTAGIDGGWSGIALICFEVVAFTASYGAVMGSAVAAMSWAKWAACIGGGLLGATRAVSKAKSAHREWTYTVPKFRMWMGGAIGLMMGALSGAFFGIMVVAFVGSLLGCAAGLLLERHFGHGRKAVLHLFPGWVMLAVAWGVAAQAFYMKPLQATEGLKYGAVAGLALGLSFCVASVPLAFLTMNKKPLTSRAAE